MTVRATRRLGKRGPGRLPDGRCRGVPLRGAVRRTTPGAATLTDFAVPGDGPGAARWMPEVTAGGGGAHIFLPRVGPSATIRRCPPSMPGVTARRWPDHFGPRPGGRRAQRYADPAG